MMDRSGVFLPNSVFLRTGLAVDAFSVSVVNGFREPGLHPLKAAGIASVFALFQAVMPMLGGRIGSRIAKKAEMIGGVVLIGLEIFLHNI